MTAERRQRKIGGRLPARLCLWLGVALAIVLVAPIQLVAAQYIVVDPHSGLAISGFDPVAYFTDAKAQFGTDAYEYRHDGTTWRFRNEGNRAAFAENPDVYTPRFGGYDPVAIARGVSVAGHPQIWLIAGQRLYLFYSSEARAEFAKQPERIIDTAERRWPAVERTLAH